jgi:hypothetical protein
MMQPEPRLATICGFACTVNDALGHVEVAHEGSITWDQLQAVKNALWGEDARAIEVFPAASDVVNSGNFRHLWRLGALDFCPDLLVGSHQLPRPLHLQPDMLENRVVLAWLEAKAAMPGQAVVWEQTGSDFK